MPHDPHYICFLLSAQHAPLSWVHVCSIFEQHFSVCKVIMQYLYSVSSNCTDDSLWIHVLLIQWKRALLRGRLRSWMCWHKLGRSEWTEVTVILGKLLSIVKQANYLWFYVFCDVHGEFVRNVALDFVLEKSLFKYKQRFQDFHRRYMLWIGLT